VTISRRPAPGRPTRRAVLAGAATLAAGCRKARTDDSKREPSFTVTQQRAAPRASADIDAHAGAPLLGELMFDFPSVSFGAERALAIVPRGQEAGERFPVLVALHGRGESVRGATAGARGWMDDYELGRSIERLGSPPLSREDFRGFVDDARLARLNASLIERPYRGLIVVCPWVPDILSNRDRANLDVAWACVVARRIRARRALRRRRHFAGRGSRQRSGGVRGACSIGPRQWSAAHSFAHE
jgi:hypothetical protein